MRKLALLSSVLFAGLLIAACGISEPVLVPRNSAVLSITPDGIADGKVDIPYDLTFEATSIPAGVSQVTFQWSFGDGKGVGAKQVDVVNGAASHTVTYSYSAKNVYGLTVLAKQSGGSVLASKSVTVGIEANPERGKPFGSCDGWRSSTQGGYGVTVDVWDISDVPAGAVFDIKYDTIRIPDKIVVEYPAGTEVLDTGWRGAPNYDGSDLYPGGLAGGGKGSADAIFSKTASNEFKVTVFGPDPATKWSYDVRCRVP